MELIIYPSVAEIPGDVLEKIKEFDTESIIHYISDPFTFNIGVVFDGDKVLGVGVIRVVNEFKMMIDPNISNLNKARISRSLMYEAIHLKQCNEVIVTLTQDEEHFARILRKHFSFYNDSNTVLRLEKHNGQ